MIERENSPSRNAGTTSAVRPSAHPRHTPGPWEVSHEPPRWIIQAECGPGKKALAYLVGDYVSCAGDARLIASAPELLEALDWLLASVTTDQPENYPGDREERLLLACGGARAAIAKAIGDGGHEPSTKGSA